ncbi:hypothetical protein IKA15_01410 [bacterium]|nr:hypothetical protein [bacterium]
MGLKKFIGNLFQAISHLEEKIEFNQRFSQSEINEILSNSKSENMRFLVDLLKIKSLSAFDISYILSLDNLSEEKIATITQASKLYSAEEFTEQGQTFSDFISKVCANLDMLNSSNIDYFKELALIKSELYDFTALLKNPTQILQKAQHKENFEFVRVLVK